MFPHIPEHVRLVKRKDCCILVNEINHDFLLLNSSEGFTISLTTGKYSVNDISYLVTYTYHLSSAKGEKLVSHTLNKCEKFIKFSPTPLSRFVRYNPKDFLYNTDPKTIDVTKIMETPVIVNIVLTRRCNFRCQYCYFGSGSISNTILPYETILGILSEAKEMGAVLCPLSGGEPTLHPQFINIVQKVVENGLVPLVSTNGSTINTSFAEQLRSAGLKSIQLSLDSSEPKIHHLLTQTSKTFDVVIKGIEALIKAGIWVRIKSIITPFNLQGIAELIDLCVNMGINEIHICPESSGKYNEPTANLLPRLSKEETLSIERIVKARQQKYKSQTLIRMNQPEKSWCSPDDIIRCGGLFSGLIIHPSGDVNPCEMLEGIRELSYGNIFEQSLKEIWRGLKHRSLFERTSARKFVDNECGKCDYLDYCHTGCLNLSKLHYGRFYAKDARCPGHFIKNV